jgi:hypothetical protein
MPLNKNAGPSSTCRICSRRLRNSISIELGIGPVCRAKIHFQDDEKQGVLFMVEKIDGFGDVRFWRDESGTDTNVPHRIKCYSPTGFEWGYGGSGPTDFALNILSVFIGEEAARANGLYQDFKWEFIAGLPHEGGTLKREDVMRWVQEKGGQSGKP